MTRHSGVAVTSNVNFCHPLSKSGHEKCRYRPFSLTGFFTGLPVATSGAVHCSPQAPCSADLQLGWLPVRARQQGCRRLSRSGEGRAIWRKTSPFAAHPRALVDPACLAVTRQRSFPCGREVGGVALYSRCEPLSYTSPSVSTIPRIPDNMMPVSLVFSEAADALGVFIRPAQQCDAEQLIQMNNNFRYEMVQWEAGIRGEDSGYPVLDYEDVTFILEEEDEGNLMVIGRRLESEEFLLGYSYSYTEPWESAESTPAKRSTSKVATPRKNAKGAKAAPAPPSQSEKDSSYIAELFIAESERGLGLGELLLSFTLNHRSRSRLGSHLFVSSKNTSAVRCYQKFGYSKCLRPSGDAAHDLIMELSDCRDGSENSARRMALQLEQGTIGARRRRKPTAQYNPSVQPEGKKAPPTALIVEVRSESRESAAPTAPASRSSSRSSFRNSPPPCNLRPLAVHGAPADDIPSPKRRMTRSADEVSLNDSGGSDHPRGSPFFAVEEDFMSSIPGRQRKERRLPPGRLPLAEVKQAQDKGKGVRGAGKRVREQEEELVGCSEGEVRPLRSSKRHRFMVTGMTDRKKQQAEKSIRALGGDVLPSDITFDPSCTHLVAAEPGLRTEKYLCALAANKPILKPEYVLDSLAAGTLLPDDGYEFPAAACLSRTGLQDIGISGGRPATRAKIASSPTKSLVFPTTGSGCFAGMCVVLVVADKTMAAGLRRVLIAGGAVLRGEVSNGSVKAPSIDGATHALVNRDLLDPGNQRSTEEAWTEASRKVALRAVADMQAKGVECLYRDFPVEYLTGKNVSPALFRLDAGPLARNGSPSGVHRKAVPQARSGALTRVLNAGMGVFNAIQLLSPKRLRSRAVLS